MPAARRMAKNIRIVLQGIVANFTLSVSESVSMTRA
jgi:ABC-type cobalamin/Fe3+-siderophores transport system ATPase subunit